MSSLRPPLRWLASLLLRGERGDVILGDLEETFYRQLEEGVPAPTAKRRYVYQVVSSAFAVAREPEPARARTAPRRGDGTLAQTGGDFGFALRSLWRRPGFSIPVILTLALGMGVSATVFSVVEAVLIPASP